MQVGLAHKGLKMGTRIHGPLLSRCQLVQGLLLLCFTLILEPFAYLNDDLSKVYPVKSLNVIYVVH